MSTELTIGLPVNPAVILTSAEESLKLIACIKREIDSSEPDVETDHGRKAIASLAYKISRTKTAIDNAGAELIEEDQKRIKLVNAERKNSRDTLDELRDHARAPLTEWEDVEKDRLQNCRASIDKIRSFREFPAQASSEHIRGYIEQINEIAEGRNNYIQLTKENFGDLLGEANSELNTALEMLALSLKSKLQEEADKAELQVLRDREAERGRQEAKAAQESRAKEQEARQEQAEKDRKEQEEAFAKRQAEEAAERARQEEIDKAREIEAEKERVHAAELAKVEAEKAEMLAQRKREDDEAERQATADAKRAANKKHIQAVKNRASVDIAKAGNLEKETADKIVLSIMAGEIPDLALRF